MYLFEDVLSAVDPHVSAHICKECFYKLLGDKTVIIATHQVGILDRVDPCCSY